MSNRLQHETSPYLQQHARNPVDWYPWGEEALSRARAEDKPILLSIGYSACHWCHVMAHESFEDASIAAVMNANFVNIKVDREERPDIDQIYQAAHQMLTRRTGGWPLTMFLTPDQVPFFGGTYFPCQSRYNLPAFVQIMERVAEAYRSRRGEIEEQNRLIVDALARSDEALPGPSIPDAGLIEKAVSELRDRFDAEHGGFGGAPKFPHPTDLELCLRRFAGSGDREALHVALHTLRKMALGGIYDHLGGGFFRYSVDQSWTIPHFEKMLYDNAQLLPLYADAWAITREPLFERVAVETAAWVIGEMQSPQSGYYSSLDADSEGEEGKFYVWNAGEVRGLLSDAEYAVAGRYFGLSDPPNFVDHQAGPDGAWHLRVVRALPEVAAAAGVSPGDAGALLESARAKLLKARTRRVRPACDDKILTSWNALMIAGMARAAFVFARDDWAQSARRALGFIMGRMTSGDSLFATFRDDRARLHAYLDDYAFLIKAVLAMQALSFSAEELAFAQRLADTLLGQFEDTARGGFFFTSHDHEQLIHRPKSAYDNVMPSGNSVAAQALVRLGHLTGNLSYLRSAERALEAFGGSIAEHPAAFSAMLLAAEEVLTPPSIIVLRGEENQFPAWRGALSATYRPSSLLVATDAPAGTIPEVLGKPVPARGVSAYVCKGASCLPPVDNIEALRALLA